MKIIAWHLPQYHTIKENNEWWGEGFTEWTNVKKAESLFKGHNQPRIPLDNNYYNLLEKKTMKWQSDLAKEYGIYGFCYYHYWFNGKLLLEKPLENLLEWKDIEFPFCLSWANEPWTRAWDGQDKEVLMPQIYGKEQEWENHFNYLLPFFKDDRYIKVNGKPMFLIYRTESIPNCERMIEFWNQLALKNNIEGIHIIETLNSFQKEKKCSNTQGQVYMEPMYTLSWDNSLFDRIMHKISKFERKTPIYTLFDYELIWKKIIKRNYKENDYLGTFMDWDNTARKKNGLISSGTNIVKFEKYFSKQCKNLKKQKGEFIFINAWNEWAEGTYLEPDEINKFSYLEVIKKCRKLM